MWSLLDGQKKIHEQILKLQARIEEEEAAYLEETAHGNIIRGWDGFIDSKQSRKEAALKKIKPYTEVEHLFSNCCFYSSLANEPTIELADYFPKEEASGRRRAATPGLVTTATSGVGRPSASPAAVQKPALERKQSFSGGRGTVGSNPGSAPVGRPPKKKRRRLDHLEVASTASATHSETGEDDDKEPPLTLKKSRSMSSTDVTATAVSADTGDFADML